MPAKCVLTSILLSFSLALIAWRCKEEMAMEEYGTAIMASQRNPLWDLRDVPLGLLSESAEARQVVDNVMTRTAIPSCVIVSSFSSSV
jgi:hypothetical protein